MKCCLVYEQAVYAEARKGLPKLGKRVVTPDGEGRVVEVNVLVRKVRVRMVDGNSEVYTANEVEPMFPPQQQKPKTSEGQDGKKRRRKRKKSAGQSAETGSDASGSKTESSEASQTATADGKGPQENSSGDNNPPTAVSDTKPKGDSSDE